MPLCLILIETTNDTTKKSSHHSRIPPKTRLIQTMTATAKRTAVPATATDDVFVIGKATQSERWPAIRSSSGGTSYHGL